MTMEARLAEARLLKKKRATRNASSWHDEAMNFILDTLVLILTDMVKQKTKDKSQLQKKGKGRA